MVVRDIFVLFSERSYEFKDKVSLKRADIPNPWMRQRLKQKTRTEKTNLQ